DEQHAEPDLATRLISRDAPRARAVHRARPQLIAPASLERHLLLERQLDLSHALSHPHLSHRKCPPGRSCRLASRTGIWDPSDYGGQVPHKPRPGMLARAASRANSEA